MKLARPKVIAHRGASASAPENSLEAFARARADGADGVELDVRLCGSGELLVFHDQDLRRLGDRTDRIAMLPLSTLQQLRLRSGVRIPLLPEVFEVCGPDMLVNVEIKTDGLMGPKLRALIDAVAADLAGLPHVDRVVLSSFNPLAIVAAAARMPHVRRGLLFESGGPLWARAQALANWLPIQSVHPQDHLCTREAVVRWKALGYAINVWTVDDPARQDQLAALEVDGIITNRPAEARQWLERSTDSR